MYRIAAKIAVKGEEAGKMPALLKTLDITGRGASRSLNF
jgi:hypothetical protein